MQSLFKTRECAEFIEFTSMQVKNMFLGILSLLVFWWKNADTFKTATNVDMLKSIVILRKENSALCFNIK